MGYSTVKFLAALDESTMPISAKLIRDSLLNGTYVRSVSINEAKSNITKMELKKEKYGHGVSVQLDKGVEYCYAANDTDPKHGTPETLLADAQKMLKYRGSGATLGWLTRNGILYAKYENGKSDPFRESKELCDQFSVKLV